ncbi:MAG: PIG-L family deacetylase [Microthrixaceae bacterium]|nr:PIG-L family deacetylase [Microthrixaceae bacterium]
MGLDVPGTAVAVGAHPDDVEFWCGATLARWAAAGAVVHVVICTDGSKGTWDPHADTAALAERRAIEARSAAARLGTTGEVVLLGNVDGELVADRAATERVAFHLRRLRPDVVLGHDPWKRYRLHPDHRAAGFLTVDGVVAARDPHFFPQQGVAAHRPSELLLFEADEANHAEPGDPQWLDHKIGSLLTHESQLETTHFYRVGAPADRAAARAAFADDERRKMAEAGRPFGLALAEVFHRMSGM